MNSQSNVSNIEDYKKPKSIWSSKIFLTLVATLSCVVGALSYYWFDYSKTRIVTDDAYVETDLFPVNSRMMGFVKEVLVKENDPVKKGQTLIVFDDTDINIEVGFKKAKLAKAKADMARAKKLSSSKALSTSDFELAKANLFAMQSDYDGSLLKLRYTKILAPVDGVIAKKNIEAGQFVQPGQGMMVIVPVSPIWIKANYKETQLENVKVGMKVIVTVDAYPGIDWVGHVESISPSSGAKLSLLPPENASGNFTKIVQRIPLVVNVDSGKNSKPTLRPGMSVTTTILAFTEPEK
jgi:membrane fusion protein, multidrug efflux system